MNDNSRDREVPNTRTVDIVLALSVGLLAGVAGALLLAPASGRQTRQRIGQLGGQVTGKTSRMVHRAGDILKEQAERVDYAFAEGKQAYRQGPDNKPS